MSPFQTLFDAQKAYFATGHLFPPYSDAKSEELEQWLDY